MHKQYLQETRQQGPQQASYNSYYENFFIHYGFPAKLHSDKGVNFENKIIKQLCKIANIRKTRTTPYHLMGNGVVGRFDKSPLSMLVTMTNGQKLNRKEHVSTWTQAYNAILHESTGYSLFYLMFGRHSLLATGAFHGLQIGTRNLSTIRIMQNN